MLIMKKLFTLGALLVATTVCVTAYGQAVQDIPPGEDRITAVHAGEPSPFAGQLFDNDTALRWGNWLRQLRARLVIDVQKERNVCAVRTDGLNKELDVERAKYAEMTRIYEKRIAELSTPPNSWAYFTAGFVGATLSILGTQAATK
jgi:hypothetical protein